MHIMNKITGVTGATGTVGKAVGEQLALRVVARYADIWNGPGPAEAFQHKSSVIDRYCAQIGRDPATIVRSAEIPFDPQENPEIIRQRVGNYIAAGATHLVSSRCESGHDTQWGARIIRQASHLNG